MAEAARNHGSQQETDPEQQLKNFEVGDRFGTDPTRKWEVIGKRSDGIIIESPGGCTFSARVHDDGVFLHSGPNSSNRVVRIRKFASPIDAKLGVLDHLDEGDVFEVNGRPDKFKVESVFENGAAAEVAQGGFNGWNSPNYRLKEEWDTFGVPARMEYQHRKQDHHDFEIPVRDLRVL